MEANTSRAEAERLLGVSEKLLQNRDLNGSRDFAILAQETEPFLALILHPDKNKFAFADQAFKLVAQAWAVLSDSIKKPLYNNELNLFSKIDLTTTSASAAANTTTTSSSQQNKLPIQRTNTPARNDGNQGTARDLGTRARHGRDRRAREIR